MRPINRQSSIRRESTRKQLQDLGDTDASDTFSDSSAPNETQMYSTFQSADIDKEATDYGLEFTTNRIRKEALPRHSSLRRHTSLILRGDTDNEGVGNSSQVFNRTRGSSQPFKSSNVAKKSTSRSQGFPQTVQKKPAKQVHRRKQITPQRRAEKFMKEVKRLQETTHMLMPRLPFSRVVRELMQESSSSVGRITQTAFEALQTAAELYLTQRFEDSYMLTLHRGRITLDVRDMLLVNYIRSQIA